MSAQFFIDRATTKLANVRRTPQGGMLVDATLAKVGVMTYVDGKGATVKRYNAPDVLEAATSSVVTAPVTRLHPPKFVDVHNYQQYAAGHVVGTPTFVDGHIRATLAIQDAQLIRDIELGVMSEVSMGYSAVHDGTPGVTDDGETYDERRTSIEWNHLSIVPAGRAGKSVRLLLDGEDIPEVVMMALKIDGLEIAVDSAQSAFDVYDAKLQAQIATASAELETLRALVVELDAALVEAKSDAVIDAAIAARDARLAVEAEAKAKLERVAKAFPGISLDGRSSDFIDALDLAHKADPSGLGQLDGTAPAAPVVKKTEAKLKYDARAAMRARNLELSSKPVSETATSK